MSKSKAQVDPFELRKFYKHLRVVDVVDAMDGIGSFDVGLMRPEVRPLWVRDEVLGGGVYGSLCAGEPADVEAEDHRRDR